MSAKYYSLYLLNALIYSSHKPSYRVFSFLFLDTSGFCSSLEVIFLWQAVSEGNLRGIVQDTNTKVDETCLAWAAG